MQKEKQQTVMLNSFQHPHLIQTLAKKEEILNQVQDDTLLFIPPYLTFGTRPLPQGARVTTRGFTLIELLVVVLIIGILAAVAVPQYRIAVAKSQYATLKDLTESIRQAEEIYYLANGEYVSDFEVLDIQMPGGKKNNSTANYYAYKWGSCFTGNTGNGETERSRACCYNTDVNLGYCVHFDHSNQKAKEKACSVLGTTNSTDWKNKICQAETHRTTYSSLSSSDNTVSYKYQ